MKISILKHTTDNNGVGWTPGMIIETTAEELKERGVPPENYYVHDVPPGLSKADPKPGEVRTADVKPADTTTKKKKK